MLKSRDFLPFFKEYPFDVFLYVYNHIFVWLELSFIPQFRFRYFPLHTFFPRVFSCRTPNCDQQCGPGQGILGPPDRYGCSQCQCRPLCAPYNREACQRDCANRGGTFEEQRDQNGCLSCGCRCRGSLFY